jgi:membrane protease YdiL (CAAX protease family)
MSARFSSVKEINQMYIQSTKTNIEPSKRGILPKFFWKAYFSLVFAGMIGVVAALPSAWSVIEKTAALSKVPAQLLAAGQLIQSTFWMFFAVGIGLLLAAKSGLGAPILRGFLAGEQVGAKLRSQILPSGLLALFATMTVIALDRLFFIPRMPGFSSAISQISGWNGMLASLYGGITEEILTRLFFLTFLAWILSRFSHTDDGQPSSTAMWIAIVSSAILFGLGHLPATLQSTPFSMIVLTRAVLLNGICGTLFGYLYWRRGLESSMISHFTSDLLVHVILPAML